MAFSSNRDFDVVKDFEDNFLPKVTENAEKYIEDILKESKVNLEENESTVNEINKFTKQKNNTLKQLQKNNKIKKVLTFFTVMLLIVLIGAIATMVMFKTKQNKNIEIALIVVASVLIPLFLYLIFGVLKPKIKNSDKLYKELLEKIEKLLKLAKSQIFPIVREIDHKVLHNIISNTLPFITFDEKLTVAKHKFLHNKFNFEDTKQKNTSTVYIQSGNVHDNPFLLRKKLNFEMSTKIYSGFRTVTYVERYYANGSWHSQSVTETLEARIEKPFPDYFYTYEMFYGNDAAPDLIFTREPSSLRFSKDLNKAIQNKFKELEKLEKKAVKLGHNFTMLDNREFEVLFNALNRNNEQQFRIMFTALAQQQMTEILKDKKYFGDNFSFVKNGKTNLIIPYFIENNMNLSYTDYLDEYYYKTLTERLKNDIVRIFHHLYYLLAPIFAIPAYMHKQAEKYDPLLEKNYKEKYAISQHEELVNELVKCGYNINPQATTKSIVNIVSSSKNNMNEIIKINAHGHYDEPRVEYVSVMAKNGKYYDVPVDWNEYLPCENSFECEVENTNISKAGDIIDILNAGNISCSHNLICKVLNLNNN